MIEIIKIFIKIIKIIIIIKFKKYIANINLFYIIISKLIYNNNFTQLFYLKLIKTSK